MDQDHLNNLRHSCAHLLAAAVLDLYPKVKLTIGPPIEDGFYYDFDFGDSKISESDFPKIEEKMRELVKGWRRFERIEDPNRDKPSKRDYPSLRDNPYKEELLAELLAKGEPISFYLSGNFADLCRGGHVDRPNDELKYFKLLKIAGAYWRGSEKNEMLTRIYGTCFKSQKELDEYLWQLEETKKRDHRKIGTDLDLFVFSDLVGKGLPSLTPKGTVIRRELEKLVMEEEGKRGYQHVITPVLAKTDLFKTSGHYPYYKETMYPVMKVDDEELILRPMTCPHHFMLYKSKPRSYRDLPIRYAELSPQFRYEKSGELSGLTRVRTFCLADAHIICLEDQAKDEIIKVLQLIDDLNKILGLEKGKDYRYRLSLGDRQDTKKYYKNNKLWDKTEKILREVLEETKAPFFEAQGEAAFYGPKIDIQMKRISGQEETAFTVQYDFVMPERFSMRYVNKEGKEIQPIVIHRSSIGALERTMAFLIEKYAGAFPLWLAPVQVAIIPISDKVLNYTQGVLGKIKETGIRAELNDKNETMQTKIRDAQLQKIPYMIVIGNREQEAGSVSLRLRDGRDLGNMSLGSFINHAQEIILTRSLNLW